MVDEIARLLASARAARDPETVRAYVAEGRVMLEQARAQLAELGRQLAVAQMELAQLEPATT